MEITDISLLTQIAERKTHYFNILYERYNRLFFRWIFTRVGNKEVAKEIAQNFWLQIWNDPDYFKRCGKSCVKDFFLRVLTFKILDYLKSSAMRNSGEQILLYEIEKSLSYTHVLEEMEMREIYKILDDVLANVPQLTKDIFTLRYNEEYSVNETASALNISPKRVRLRYQGVLTMLKEQLLGIAR